MWYKEPIIMKAYKFRGADQIPYALDIIFNNRLYCSNWSELNDPNEGAFAYTCTAETQSNYKEQIEEIIQEKMRLKVCSLSKTYDSHLLWAHYASGFRGVAIEVELPDTSPAIKAIEYGAVFASIAIDHYRDSIEVAEKVLSSKYLDWSYEQEVRILQSQEWYELVTPVKRVICGHRMNPAMFEALQIVCEKKSIILHRTGIGDEGIDADKV